jgi:putative transposase
MKTLALVVIHALSMAAQRVGPGGIKAIIAESVLLKHQQLIARRSVGKMLRLTISDRLLCGFLVLFMHPGRIQKVAVVLKPATLTKFRRVLLSRNYHRLSSSQKNRKPGPKGPSDNLVRVIV